MCVGWVGWIGLGSGGGGSVDDDNERKLWALISPCGNCRSGDVGI